tara:strand:- start:156 stop:434 length:279 start_codon:yes stop_codon:yes gene_type:complete
MFNSVPKRSSTFVQDLKVDLRNSKAVVYLDDGSIYGYRFVSKRAILNILFNPTISLGFWVNRNLFQSNRAVEDWQVIPQSEGQKPIELPDFI